MRYKVGDKVRVRRDLNKGMIYNEFTVTTPMADKAGDIVTISAVSRWYYHIAEYGCCWTDEMFEGLVEEELTAEEAIRIKCEMCESISCSECKFSRANNGEDIYCNKFLEKYPEQVVEILKQWKKDHEKKEVEVESKLYCRIIDGGDGSTVRSEALQDGINLNDEIKEILAKYCSEHVGDYFAVCENRWMVKQ